MASLRGDSDGWLAGSSGIGCDVGTAKLGANVR